MTFNLTVLDLPPVAIYHFTAKIISASDGKSAVGAAAYVRGAVMQRESSGKSYSYIEKTEVTHSEIIMPPNAPAWAKERYTPDVAGSERLWNDIERRENEHSRRASAQLARSLEFSLPAEMNHAEQVALARDFITNSLAVRGYVCDWSLHFKPENPHIHVLFTERMFTEDEGVWGKKIRVSNRRQQLLELRAEWAMAANQHLERGGYEARIDHRSNADAGLALEPGRHRGPEPRDAEEHEAWQARVDEDTAIQSANEKWLREHPAELVNLVAVKHETINRSVLLAEALQRLSFRDRAEAESYVEEAIQSGVLTVAGEDAYGGEAWHSVVYLQQLRGLMERAELLNDSRWQGNAIPEDALQERKMNADQQRAAEAVMAADSRLAVITGVAGTGKTRMLHTVAEILDAEGVEVLGGALSGRAAAELRSPHIRTRTIAGWLQRRLAWTSGDRPFVFICDEAGMAGVRDLAALTAAVEDRGGKLVLVGDAGQLQPIAAGTAFKYLRDRFGAVEMGRVQRQADPADRMATLALSQGRATDALKHYQAKGAVAEHSSRKAAIGAIADEYWALRGATVALAHRNVDVDALNQEIRAAGVKAGKVTGPWEQYANRNGVVHFADGDRVIATRTIPDHKVLKGTFGIIRRIDNRLVVKFAGDAMVPLDASIAGRISLGYATTIHKSQGLTSRHAIVLASETMDRHLGYVSLSRHRETLRIHLDTSSIANVYAFASRLQRSARRTPPRLAMALTAGASGTSGTSSAMEPSSPSVSLAPEARNDSGEGIMDQALTWYRSQLDGDHGVAARAYVSERGLDPAIMDRFGIGFAPGHGSGVIAELTRKGFTVDDMVAAGLVIRPDDGRKPYERFRDRVMLPIRSPDGDCIAFGGRAMSAEAQAKYLNSPATALFDKGRTLYNFDRADPAAQANGSVIVAEGYLDVVALDKIGLRNVVAPLGTAITAEQLELAWSAAPALLFVLDGDEAGRRAAYRLVDLALPLLKGDRGVHCAMLPEGSDPDSLIHDGQIDVLSEQVASARSLVDVLWNRETEGRVFDSPERRAALDKALKDAVMKIPDPAIREDFMVDLSTRLEAVFGYGSDFGPQSGLTAETTTLADMAPSPDVQRNGPGMVENDGHVESVIVHYSNLLAAAEPEAMIRTETGQAMADAPGVLARHMAASFSAWTVNDAAKYLARHVEDPLTFRRVLTEALRDSDVMTLLPESPEHPERLLSTWSRVQLEADMVADASLLSERQAFLPGAQVPKYSRLPDGQKEILTDLFTGSALQIVDGVGGSGKTTVAGALHSAADNAGLEVLRIVPSQVDAILTRAELANPASVRTVHQPLPRPKCRLYIVDSAEALEQGDLARVLRRAQQEGSRVVLFGDSQGTEPFTAGSPYAALLDRFPAARFAGSRRQESAAERAFVDNLGRCDGDGDQAALVHLAEHGRLHAAPDMDSAVQQMVDGYLADRSPDKIMVVHTRAQAAALNRAVMARKQGRAGRSVAMYGGRSLDVAVGDVMMVRRGMAESVVPMNRRAVVTSVTPGGRIGLDFCATTDEGGRFAYVDARSIWMEHAWATTVSAIRDAVASVHYLAGATNNRQTAYTAMSRHRDRVNVYTPANDPEQWLGRLLNTSGRQRFALDYEPALTPDGQRMLADYLSTTGRGTEDWLDRIHRTGRRRALDRAMGDVGAGLVGYSDDWITRVMRYAALGTSGSAQRWLQQSAVFTRRPDPVVNAIGDSLVQQALSSPVLRAGLAESALKDASIALSAAVSAEIPADRSIHAGDSQDNIRRVLKLGGGEGVNWLTRLWCQRRARVEAQEIACTRQETQLRREIAGDLGISDAVIQSSHPHAWVAVPNDVRTEYDKQLEASRRRIVPKPTALDLTVAYSHLYAEARNDSELADHARALREVLEQTPVPTAREVERERKILWASLTNPRISLQSNIWHRMYRAFTHAEIEACIDDRKSWPRSLPSVDSADRQAMSARLASAARNLSPALNVPWANRVRSLSRGYGQDGWFLE
ncbi:MAG: AAA family ATPase [Rhodobacteraceae bacterium]|nr:AAA family ATPase [Paracoccaceae bacterium]